MRTPPVGADIESLCSKCGDVWHVVVAKVGEKIAKVQCKQCGGFHRHRPLPGAEPPPAAAKGPVVKKARAKAEPKPQTPSVEADKSKPLRRYSPKERYESGDRLEHPQFGSGVVESSPGPGKMQVFFPGGRRVLVMARPDGGGLARPGTTIEDEA
jgi:hypothetical protein